MIPLQQRIWLSALEKVQPGGRPILAQTAKEDEWRPWRDLPPGSTVWTRSILLNEVVFDPDAKDAEANWETASQLRQAARTALKAYGGGKSTHVHLFIDPLSVGLPTDIVPEVRLFKVDVWKAAREVVFAAVVKAAGLTEEQAATLDPTKVRWTADRRGSMIREFGSTGSTGRHKTLGAPGTCEFPTGAPPLYDARAHEAAITKRVMAELEKRKKPAAPAEVSHGLKAHPCVSAALQNGAPEGERKKTAVHLATLAALEGATAAEAEDLLSQFFRRCGLDDLPARFVEYAASRDVKHIACPNPLGLSVCGSGAGCPRRKLRL